MKKKLWTVVITLICSFLAGYIFYNHEMNATSVITYTAGGNVTGRVNKAPNGIVNDHIGFKKGDKIYSFNIGSTELSWQLLLKDTYTDYGCGSFTTVCSNTSITSFLAATTELYGSPFYATNGTSDFRTIGGVDGGQSAEFSNLPSFQKMYGANGFSNLLVSGDNSVLIAPRNLGKLHLVYNSSFGASPIDYRYVLIHEHLMPGVQFNWERSLFILKQLQSPVSGVTLAYLAISLRMIWHLITNI